MKIMLKINVLSCMEGRRREKRTAEEARRRGEGHLRKSSTIKLVLAKICPTRISEFIRPGKNQVRTRIFRLNFKSDIKFFTFLLSESDFDPNLPSSELSDPKKRGIGHQFLVRILTLSELSDPNLTRTRIFASARQYIPDPQHVISFELLQLKENLTYVEEPNRIIDRKDRALRNRAIPFVKVLWKHHQTADAACEPETEMRQKYPHVFDQGT